MNKRGNVFAILLFFGLLIVVLLLGFLMVVGSSVLNWTFDEMVPELTNLGQIGDTNMTAVAQTTIVPLNTTIQSFTWLTGVLYVMLLVGVLGFSLAFRGSPPRWLMGFFLLLVCLLYTSPSPRDRS